MAPDLHVSGALLILHTPNLVHQRFCLTMREAPTTRCERCKMPQMPTMTH